MISSHITWCFITSVCLNNNISGVKQYREENFYGKVISELISRNKKNLTAKI